MPGGIPSVDTTGAIVREIKFHSEFRGIEITGCTFNVHLDPISSAPLLSSWFS